MRILVIPSWFPNENKPFDGNFVERHVNIIAKKHEVIVLNFFSYDRQEISQDIIQKENYTLIEIKFPASKSKIALTYSFYKILKQIRNSLDPIDLIHGHVILEKGLIFLLAKSVFKKPLYITEHASYLIRENYKKLSFLQKLLIIQNFKVAKKVSCVSEFLKSEIQFLFPRMNVSIIPNSIESEIFDVSENTNSETIEFIHISTLDEIKNVPIIISAFEKLASKANFKLKLKIIGEKKNEIIENQINTSSQKNKIELLGPLQLSEVAEHLSQSSALVMLSNYETFSCVIAEAWSCGIPTIATKVGIAKNLDPQNGISVDSTSEEDLISAMNLFLKKKHLFSKEEIRKSAEIYNNEAVGIAFENFYK